MIGEGLIGVEEVARAICAAYGDEFDEQPADIGVLRQWRAAGGAREPDGTGIVRAYDPGLPTQADWKECASAAISAHLEALIAAGWVVVPIGPTREMQDAGDAAGLAGGVVLEDDNETITVTPAMFWLAMVAAAPLPNSSEGSRTTEEET